MANTLFLVLEGPLQSWGERARWSVRDSSSEPTKSGIVGLLGCALGIADDERLRQLAEYMQLGVRVDRPGRMMIDYHTITGGVLSAEGKIKRNKYKEPENVITFRQYLCDACFVAALRTNDARLIDLWALALQNPVWPYYLGRKSCPPTRPVFGGVGDYDSLEEALQDYPAQLRSISPTRAVIECNPGQGTMRRDQTGSRAMRTFLPRYTRDVLITPKTSEVV
jgi:CRISPR system Cascade subunit CasD